MTNDNGGAGSAVTNIRLKNIEDKVREIADTLKVSYVTQDQHKLYIQQLQIAQDDIKAIKNNQRWFITIIVAETLALVFFVARMIVTGNP